MEMQTQDIAKPFRCIGTAKDCDKKDAQQSPLLHV